MAKSKEWTSEKYGFSKAISAQLVFHSMLIVIAGFFGGLAWIIVLGGWLELWPLPPFTLDLPETRELWRNAHTGPMMNGMLTMTIVLLAPLLQPSVKQAKWLFYSILITLYGNLIGYSFAPYGTGRGLQPEGNLANIISYSAFYVAVATAFLMAGITLYAAYSAARRSE